MHELQFQSFQLKSPEEFGIMIVLSPERGRIGHQDGMGWDGMHGYMQLD